MRAILLSLILATACGHSSEHCNVDAFQRDWYWAWSQYDGFWCDWFARCLPDQFATYYHDRAQCISDNADSCDSQFGYEQCRTAYPDDRQAALTQCGQDYQALDCAALLAPNSCSTALIP